MRLIFRGNARWIKEKVSNFENKKNAGTIAKCFMRKCNKNFE